MKSKDKLTDRIRFLEKQIEQLSQGKKLFIHDYYGKHIKFGVVSDSHIGSLYDNPELLHLLYKMFRKEGIDSVYHVGDIVDGDGCYRGQHYDQYAVGLENQVNEVTKKYPNFKGMTTYLLEGNHGFKNISGAEVGKIISDRRKDIVYLDMIETDIMVGGKNKTRMRLVHPGGGTAYALSYRPQKIIESITGGKKPNIILIGHYHKAEFIPLYRNVYSIQAGCTEHQTPYMKGRAISAQQGGWILDFYVGKSGINQFKAQFIPFYEK